MAHQRPTRADKGGDPGPGALRHHLDGVHQLAPSARYALGAIRRAGLEALQQRRERRVSGRRAGVANRRLIAPLRFTARAAASAGVPRRKASGFGSSRFRSVQTGH